MYTVFTIENKMFGDAIVLLYLFQHQWITNIINNNKSCIVMTIKLHMHITNVECINNLKYIIKL